MEPSLTIHPIYPNIYENFSAKKVDFAENTKFLR